MESRKTKILLLGVGVAALLGLMAGGLATPDFATLTTRKDAEPTPTTARRGLGHEMAANWTSFTGEIPDYVIGTDWATLGAAAAALQDIPAEADPPAQAAAAAPPPPAVVRAVAHASDAAATAEAPPPPPPSIGGDILAGMDSYAPPTPPDPGVPNPPAY
jgi:hypothetical protein